MLRTFQTLRQTARPGALIAADDERAVLLGGGNGYVRPWHWHDCLMLLLPTAGALDIRYEDRPQAAWISDDRFAVVPANRVHETTAVRDNHAHIAMYVTTDALLRIEADLGSLSRVRARAGTSSIFAATPEIRALQKLCRDGDSRDIATPAVHRHLAAALLIRCLAQIEQTDAMPQGSLQTHGAMLVSEVSAFIEAHVAHDVSLDQLADRFGVSRRHITRLFRDHTGRSIGEFQQVARLTAAQRLLTETDLPIGEIAFRVGFESGAALARAMRRFAGLAPSAIRAAVVRPLKARSVKS